MSCCSSFAHARCFYSPDANTVPGLTAESASSLLIYNTESDPTSGVSRHVKTDAKDLTAGDKVKLKPVCAYDNTGAAITGYYAYGPQ